METFMANQEMDEMAYGKIGRLVQPWLRGRKMASAPTTKVRRQRLFHFPSKWHINIAAGDAEGESTSDTAGNPG
ncbi:unnamed protein product [Lasius platythorax]|uniref:Uncharacterized protein n=1 Tax=Lasius platythorax TaxID=488582 RepID=A0AAV2NBU2_9HYME